MVHWPEVIMTYDDADKVLFSADAFGKFGALDMEEPWLPEARRYFIGIVGKYGVQVQAVLKKAAALDIETVCSLHGPVLHKEQLGDVLAAYDAWSAYRPETEGVLVAYSSIYGHTAEAANRLAEALREKGVETVAMDLAQRASCTIWPGATWRRPWRTHSATESWCWLPPPTTPTYSPSCAPLSSI